MTIKHMLQHGHFALAAASLAMLATGTALISGEPPGFATHASAQAGPQLEISLPSPVEWLSAVGPAWQMDNAAPGDTVLNSVLLRTVDVADSSAMYLTLRAELGSAADTSLAEALLIDEMRLGGLDLLPAWLGHCGGSEGELTLAEVVDCNGDVRLPVPSAAGSAFAMGITFSPGAGNRLQAANTGPVTFYFDLWEFDGTGPGGPPAGNTPGADELPSPSASPSPSPSPTAIPEDGSPSPTSTPGPGEEGTVVPVFPPDEMTSVPVSPVGTPAPPDTGSGSSPSARGFGWSFIGLGALGIAAWLVLLDAGARRRRTR